MIFEDISEAKIETVHDPSLALSEKECNDMEKDFREIDCIATEGGAKAIIDETDWHGEKLGTVLSDLESFHDLAF